MDIVAGESKLRSVSLTWPANCEAIQCALFYHARPAHIEKICLV